MGAAKTLKVIIAGDPSGAVGALGDVESKADGLSGKFNQVGQTAAVGFAAVGAAVVGAGVALYQVGANFDDAYDKIRVGTGATGDALDGLKDDFRSLAANSADSFDDISSAMTLVNQRLGVMGEPLQDLTAQFLDLARITGGDVTASIETMTRVFGDWSVDTARQGDVMDEFFRASQATGVGIDKLAEQVVQFGAPLRGLGFNMEDAIAMFGKWEKEGVNVENVMGAMKKAYGEFSKEFGQRAPEEFRKFVTEISKAPNAAAAAAMAIEKLGVRNGPDFAAAVQEGRFSYEGLVDLIKDGTDTITDAARDTEDFAEKWQRFTNRMQLMVEPLASGVFDAVANAMEAIGPVAEVAAAWLGDRMGEAVAKLGGLWEQYRPAIESAATAVGDAIKAAGDKVREVVEWMSKPENDAALKAIGVVIGTLLVAAFHALALAAAEAAAPVVAATWPLLALGAAVGGLAFLFFKAYDNIQGFHDAVENVKGAAASFWNDVLVPLGAWLRDEFTGNILPKLQTFLQWFSDTGWPAISKAVQWFYETALKPLLEYIGQNQEQFKNLGVVLLIVAGVVAAVVVAVVAFNVALLAIAAVIVGAVAVAVVAVIVTLSQFAQVVWDVFNNVRDALGGALERIEEGVQFVWDVIQNIGSGLAKLPGIIGGALSAAVGAVVGFVASVAGAVVGFAVQLPGLIAGWATAFWSWLLTLQAELPGRLAYVAGFVVGWVVGMGVRLQENIQAWATAALSWVVNVLTQLPGWLAAVAGAIWGWVSSTAAALPGQVAAITSNVWAWVSQVASELPGHIAEWATQVFNWAWGLAGSIAGWLGATASAIGGWIWGVASALPGQLGGWGSQFAGWAWGLAGSFGGWLVASTNSIRDWITGVPGAVAGAVGRMVDIGRGIVEGIWNGISGAGGWLMDKVRGFASGIVDGFKSALGQHSPARALFPVGEGVTQGIGVGMLNEAPGLQRAAAALMGGISYPVNMPSMSAGSFGPYTPTANPTVHAASGGLLAPAATTLDGPQVIQLVLDGRVLAEVTAARSRQRSGVLR